MNLKVSDYRLFFFLMNKGGGFGGGRSLILFFLKMKCKILMEKKL